MVLIVLTTGLLNLCVGFGLGMYLGYGPPGLMEVWDAISAELPQPWEGPALDALLKPAADSLQQPPAG